MKFPIRYQILAILVLVEIFIKAGCAKREVMSSSEKNWYG